MRPLLLILLSLFLAAPAAGAGDPDSERLARLLLEYRELAKDQRWAKVKRRRRVVAEIAAFKTDRVAAVLDEIFRKDKAQAVRVPAMLAVGRRGRLKDLQAVTRAALADRNDVYVMLLPDALADVRDDVKDEFGPWLMKTGLGSRKPVVRAAVVRSLGLLETRAASEKIADLLGKDSDERLRYECLIALARIDGLAAIPRLMACLGDKSPHLREAAVTALSLTGDDSATDLVLSRVKDPEPRVREAVARAIRQLSAKQHLLHVVGMLKDERLRVVAVAREVLEEMTGQKFGLDSSAWEMWLLDPEKSPAKPPAGGDSAARYYGMDILSDRVLFLVDTSGSMNAGKPSRIEIARKELATALSKLNPKTVFNVAGFGGSPMWWSDREKSATPGERKQAIDFVEGLSVGGETNLYDALVQALDDCRKVDTIFLLGDGCPSAGKVVEHDEIRVRARWLNRMRKVRIHTIAFVDRLRPLTHPPPPAPKRRDEDGPEAADLLLRLAEENDGTYVRREN